jgi:2-desacetyl-2-hydroxyethyl bacteriochlorophyllide A dehydrogenase
MRQAVLKKPGVIELADVDPPTCGPGQVLLRIKRIGVCGSDVHAYHGRHPFAHYPLIPGHEFSGVVEAVGEGVTGIEPGIKATATPQKVCGRCGPCRRGDYNICDVLKVFGFQTAGAACELFAVDARKVVPLPDSFTFEQGALVEPASVGAHSTSRGGELTGRNVVVLGAGPIGNLVAQACRCRGAAKVLITDLSDFRLDVAARCGTGLTLRANRESLADASRRVFGEEGFDIAFECVGIEATMEQAIAAIQKGGTIVVLGVFGERPRIDMAVMGDHELSLIGSLMYKREDYLQAVRWIDEGSIITEPLESRHFPFEQYLDAYKFIDAQGDRTMKVFIDL